MSNPWDALSKKFNSRKNITEINPDAADNILIAWPPMINQINKHFEKNISILDYGCGTGALSEKLWSLGYRRIVSMDGSQAMISIANNNYGDHISFVRGTAETKLITELVDVIIGSMVFQFIEDIETLFKNLIDILKPQGLLIFAVHNPEVVKTAIERKLTLFTDFQSAENPRKGLIHLGTASIPIFIRTTAEYDEITCRLGLIKVFENRPPFTKEFLDNYPTEVPDVSNFLVLGYTKK